MDKHTYVPPSPINLWLVTERGGKRYTVHNHWTAGALARDTHKVETRHALSAAPPAAPAASMREALRDEYEARGYVSLGIRQNWV